jgi:tetratricopeptide (TPR) repeat protein
MHLSGNDRVQKLLDQGNDEILQERYQAGVKIFREVIRLEQRNLEAWCKLGFSYYLLDQYQDAVEAFTQALQIQPSHILALARRGLAYLSDQPDLAAQDLEQVLLIEPETAEDWHGRSLAFWGLKRETETIEAANKATRLDSQNPYFWYFQGFRLSDIEQDNAAIAAYDKALEISPQYSRCWYRRGIALANIKNYDQSIISFDKALEIQPNQSFCWSWRGYVLKALNRYEEAIASFDRALEVDSDDHYSIVNRANCLKDLSRYEEAIADYDRALTIDSNDQNTWLNRAYALQSSSRYEEAVTSFDKALDISSDDYYAWLNRAHCLKALNRYEDALNSYDAAIKIESNNHFAWAGRGDTLYNAQRYEEAIANYDKTLEIQPDHYSAWLWKGHAFSNLNENDKAIDSYDRAIKIDSTDYYSLVNRAKCLQRLARHEEAALAFNKTLEIEPGDLSSWKDLGNCLIQLDQLDEALNSYETFLSLDAKNYAIWQAKVVLLKRLDRFDQAFADFKKSQELNPSCFEGWYVYADSLCSLRRYDEALHTLDKLLEAKPDYAIAWSLRSFILAMQNRYEEACTNSDRALELEPQNFLIWAERAAIMTDAGNNDESLKCYEKALEFEPERPIISWRSLINTKADIWASYGDVLMRLEQFKRALDSYEKALLIDPETLWIAPNYVKIWNGCGRAFSKLGRYEDSLTAYNRSLELDTNQLDIWLGRGEVAVFLQQDEEALKSFDSALSIEPENLKALGGRVNSLKELKRYGEALGAADYFLSLSLSDVDFFVASMSKANILVELDNYQEALDIYHQMLESELGVRFAWFIWSMIGVTLTKCLHSSDEKDLYVEMIDACNHALSLMPKQNELDISPFDYLYINCFDHRVVSTDPNFHTSFQVSVWVERGLFLKILERFEEALESFETALSIDAKNSLVWCEKGNALFHLKHYQQTIDAYDIYVTLSGDKSNWNILLQRGMAFEELTQYEKAIASYEQAIQIKPDNHVLWHRLGATLHSVGQFEKALTAYQESLKVDVRCKAAWAEQGQILTNLCRYQESLESYDRAIALDTSATAALHNGRGWALNALSFHSDALVAYDQALQIDEQFWSAWRNRGWTTYLLKGLEEALEVWDEGLLKLNPDYPDYPKSCAELHYFKGFAHYEQGRKQVNCFSNWRKARNYYFTALRLLDSSESRERYLDVLKDLIKVLSGLGQNEEADELGRLGTEHLQRLMSEATDTLKQQNLALSYACFEQLTVDSYIRSGQLVEAIKIAEMGKNTCLSWLFSACRSEAEAPNQQLWQSFDSSTAAVYWHLSPATLTTFILKPDTDIPTTLPDDERINQEEELALSNRQLLEFESWVNNWNWLYAGYGDAKDKTERENHLWRTQMSEKLEQLKQILRIHTVVDQLPDGITHLILIPHRDLHRFPLHMLFPDCFTITYLPSAQIGFTLQHRNSHKPNVLERLLSIESPNSTGEKQQKKFERLGFAALESRLVAQLFQTTTIQSHEATQEKVETSIQQSYDGLHFAGHAAYNFNNPVSSSLALTGEDRLTVADICQSDPLVQGYNLVCLSACETALTGNQTITAEYVGLVSGFLRGGASRVVSTLWTVQSVSSSLLMIKFYSLLKQRIPTATALRDAQQWLRDASCQDLINFLNILLETHLALNRSTRKFLQTEVNRFRKMPQDDRPFHDPYHWAGFTLTGLP